MPGKVDIVNDGPNITISLNGSNAMILAGGNGANGVVSLHDPASGASFPRIVLNAANGTVAITKKPEAGEFGFFEVIGLHASTGDVSVGGNGQDGDLVLFPATLKASSPSGDKTKATIHLRASDGIVRTGGGGVDGRVLVLKKDGSASLTLDGSTGDIVLSNADCAEDFDLAESEPTDPGTTMVIDEEGKLRQSRSAYDRTVAGVISGAGPYRPGIILGRTASSLPRVALAMVGKVFCKVDATDNPIRVGDLLTTSATPGHAMRATDPAKAFGAVIGKALGSSPGGLSLIPILVALQ